MPISIISVICSFLYIQCKLDFEKYRKVHLHVFYCAFFLPSICFDHLFSYSVIILFIFIKSDVESLDTEGVKNMPFQSMSLCKTDNFELKAFEKQWVQDHSDLHTIS